MKLYTETIDGDIVCHDDPDVWRQAFDGRWCTRTSVVVDGEELVISTVFLGLDHRWDGDGPPILYETSVFGGHFDQYTKRYCTRKEAIEGHKATIDMVEAWGRTD